jgi:uncharacterized protein YdaU (DUF1376 family)
MVKENRKLPFFKFDALAWLKGKVQLLSVTEKGIYIELIVRIWAENGALKNDQFLHRKISTQKQVLLDALTLLKELDIIQEENGFLSVKFIKHQLFEHEQFIEKKRIAGQQGGRPKKQPKPKKKEERRKEIKEKEEKENIFDRFGAKDSKLIREAAERIRKAHPRVSQPIKTDLAVINAIAREVDKGHPVNDAVAYIENRPRIYAHAVSLWPPKEKQFAKSSLAWFDGGCYLEDPETWKRNYPDGGDDEIGFMPDGTPFHREVVV